MQILEEYYVDLTICENQGNGIRRLSENAFFPKFCVMLKKIILEGKRACEIPISTIDFQILNFKQYCYKQA